MVKLEKITGKNVWDILKLCVLDRQKNFVASNDITAGCPMNLRTKLPVSYTIHLDLWKREKWTERN